MAKKSIKKYSFIAFAVAGIFILGGFGGVIFDRYIVPALTAFPAVTRSGIFKKLTERVTVINKTEQVVIREDDTVEKIISQPATAVVNIVALMSENKATKKEAAPTTGVLLTNDGLVVTYSEKPFGNGDLRYMALLFDALRSHFKNHILTSGSFRFGQEFLKFEPAGHCHFQSIRPFLVLYLKPKRPNSRHPFL